MPGVTYFKPQGIPLRYLEEVRISVDELEALRLKALEDLEQEEAARRMGVSRQTFQRTLESALRKVADGLVNGKALRIEGGDFHVVPVRLRCRRCGHNWEQVIERRPGRADVACPRCGGTGSHPGIVNQEANSLKKIAVISDDGRTVSAHFGRARFYVVLSTENGQVVSREVRDKVGHHAFGGEHHAGAHGGHDGHGAAQAPAREGAHGYDQESQDKHAQMAGNISDCQVVLAGGMGWGAYDSLQGYGLEAIITDIRDVDEAVRAYLDGTIRNLIEKLH